MLRQHVPPKAAALDVQDQDGIWIVKFRVFNQDIAQHVRNLEMKVSVYVCGDFFGVKNSAVKFFAFVKVDVYRVNVIYFVVVAHDHLVSVF
jgi:hypothetical protein